MDYKRCYAVISLPAIYNNLKEVRSRIPEGTSLLAVIKANGYGHGCVEIAKYVGDIVDMFAVACLDEAIELRYNGIIKPILILGYTSPSQYEQLVSNNIIPTLYNYAEAIKVSEVSKKLGLNAKVHVAIDSGMTRIGFRSCDESVKTIEKISKLDNIKLDGIFTHLSCADMESEDAKAHTIKQLDEFDYVVNELKNLGVNIPLVHAFNSAGIMQYENRGYTCFRSGIVTYGMYPSDEVNETALNLKPALSWYAHVINIADVEAGRAVSYGATYVTDKKVTKIATISAGYADGYPRALSNKGRVIINGQYAPIIGRVCMDQFMVDVSDIDNVAIEDIAVLIGTMNDASITAEELAGIEGTINYEITCKLSPRVTRIYIR